jgi:hypothetical protein
MLNSIRHRLIALVVTFSLAISLSPAMASSMPQDMSPGMTLANGMMNCDQQLPMPDRHMPCDNSATCLGMLGCATAAVLPPMAFVPVNFLAFEPSWSPQREPDEVSMAPALPPPIV